jgi:hypothetical protein
MNHEQDHSDRKISGVIDTDKNFMNYEHNHSEHKISGVIPPIKGDLHYTPRKHNPSDSYGPMYIEVGLPDYNVVGHYRHHIHDSVIIRNM